MIYCRLLPFLLRMDALRPRAYRLRKENEPIFVKVIWKGWNLAAGKIHTISRCRVL